MVFTPGTAVLAMVNEDKALVWLDRMLQHRVDPTNAMIGSDNT